MYSRFISATSATAELQTTSIAREQVPLSGWIVEWFLI